MRCISIVAAGLLASPYISAMIRLYALYLRTGRAAIALELVLGVWLLNLDSTSICGNCRIGGDATWYHVVFQTALLTCLSEVVVAEFLVHDETLVLGQALFYVLLSLAHDRAAVVRHRVGWWDVGGCSDARGHLYGAGSWAYLAMRISLIIVPVLLKRCQYAVLNACASLRS